MILFSAVASRKAKVTVSIATEMLENFRQNKALPILVEINRTDDEYVRRVKRIIRHMTKFRSMDRKNIQEVEEEYEGSCFNYIISMYTKGIDVLYLVSKCFVALKVKR